MWEDGEILTIEHACLLKTINNKQASRFIYSFRFPGQNIVSDDGIIQCLKRYQYVHLASLTSTFLDIIFEKTLAFYLYLLYIYRTYKGKRHENNQNYSFSPVPHFDIRAVCATMF